MWYNTLIMNIKKILSVACLAAAGLAFADSTPGMISLVTPLQAPSSDYDVKGVRLSLIYGECENFKGLDLGIINNTRADFTGIALGGANLAGGKLRGVQLGLVNWDGNEASDWSARSIGSRK